MQTEVGEERERGLKTLENRGGITVDDLDLAKNGRKKKKVEREKINKRNDPTHIWSPHVTCINGVGVLKIRCITSLDNPKISIRIAPLPRYRWGLYWRSTRDALRAEWLAPFICK
jgi:hypothetical protein